MKNIVILGNSVCAELLYGYLSKDSRYQVLGFSVDEQCIKGDTLKGLPVIPLCNLTDSCPPTTTSIILGVGYSSLNSTRATMFGRVKQAGYRVETYVHPSASVLTDIPLGEGSVILASSVVEPDASIGENTYVWCNCTIAHHARIGNHVWVASNSVISGQAQIDDFVFVGVGVAVANGVHVAHGNIVGGGAFITRDTKSDEVWLARSAEKHRFGARDYATVALI